MDEAGRPSLISKVYTQEGVKVNTIVAAHARKQLMAYRAVQYKAGAVGVSDTISCSSSVESKVMRSPGGSAM